MLLARFSDSSTKEKKLLLEKNLEVGEGKNKSKDRSFQEEYHI
jgi:hypothetical protein